MDERSGSSNNYKFECGTVKSFNSAQIITTGQNDSMLIQTANTNEAEWHKHTHLVAKWMPSRIRM